MPKRKKNERGQVKIGTMSRMVPINGRYSFKNNEKVVAMKRIRVRLVGVCVCLPNCVVVLNLSIWAWFATLPMTPPFF